MGVRLKRTVIVDAEALQRIGEELGKPHGVTMTAEYKNFPELKARWQRSDSGKWMHLYVSDYMMYTSEESIKKVLGTVMYGVYGGTKCEYANTDILDPLRENGNLDWARKEYLKRSKVKMEPVDELSINGALVGYNLDGYATETLTSACFAMVILPDDRRDVSTAINLAEVKICLMKL